MYLLYYYLERWNKGCIYTGSVLKKYVSHASNTRAIRVFSVQGLTV